MFKSKKLKKNKFIIYIVIIAVMFSGTGFFLYKNYTLTKKSSAAYSELFDLNELKD